MDGAGAPPGGVDLAGPWELADETGAWRCAMRVPGDVHSALHEAGLIPDPYAGANELGLRWIAERDWTIRREVELPEGGAVLCLDGLDGVAEVALDGDEVFRAENSFRDWRVPVAVAAEGPVELAITFRSAVRRAAELAAAMPFPVPHIAQNNPVPHGNMLRKPACDWGWDWNIALVPFGVAGGVRLEPARRARVAGLRVTQFHDGGGRVRVMVKVEAEDADGQPFRVAFGGEERTGTVKGSTFVVQVRLQDPALWWPAGMGDPALHDLVVEVGGDVARRRIGLRTIELVSEPDAAGRSFGLVVNGRACFARGANWIPADALHGRITEAKTRDLLESAVAAHMNTIRVWGGGRYEPESFYDACDELGLMVWQDAMFACNLYPSTPEFLREVHAEVRAQAARLQPHACLALWCGDNELVGALNWFPESRADRDRYLVSYDRLNRTVEQAVREGDPGANWWPSSPSTGPLSFGDAWHDDSSGDMHMWSVWHEGKDFDFYRSVRPRFVSEFGFQSYPSLDVVRTFAEPGDRNIASPVLESHQKNAGGNARIAETMFRYFRWPARFEDFVWLSQVQQGLAIKTAVEAWRAQKPHCQGTLYWQLNDTWPCCSWSSLDYGGGWKLLHHMARTFFAPVHVMAVPGAEGIALVGVNDRPEPVDLAVTAYATRLDGAAREIGRGAATVGEAAARLLLVAPGTLGDDEVLTFGWEGGGAKAGDIFNPRPWKSYDLPDPGLRWEASRDGEAHVLTVTAEAMAFFVTAEADVPGRWDRAAVHLGPGHATRLRFVPRDAGATPTFLLRDLWSATTRQT